MSTFQRSEARLRSLAGEPGRIEIKGAATVRVGWNVPANAVELARQVAAGPPIEHQGTTVRLRPPQDGATQRAVTVGIFQLTRSSRHSGNDVQ